MKEEEKELLEELINSYLKHKEVWKQRIPSSQKEVYYFRDRDEENDNENYVEKENKLRGKLGEKLMKEVQSMLEGYEKLVREELELEKREMMFWLTGEECLKNNIEISPQK